MGKHSKEDKLRAFSRLLDIQERLRKECPWDRKQTFDSLRPNTIEETYELCDALIKHDKKNICKELGDLMEHIIFYAMLGEEAEDFDMVDICNQQSDKLMFRHDFINWKIDGEWTVSDPRMGIDESGRVVYKDTLEEKKKEKGLPTTGAEVESSWELRKQQERDGNKTVLSGVPASLPALIKAYRIQDKARNVGFDWKKKEDVWDKVREELAELEVELNKDNEVTATQELGDFLFSVINAARLYHLNPDNALEYTNQKFIHRFNYVEAQLKAQGKSFNEVTIKEMDALWNEAKLQEQKTN